MAYWRCQECDALNLYPEVKKCETCDHKITDDEEAAAIKAIADEEARRRAEEIRKLEDDTRIRAEADRKRREEEARIKAEAEHREREAEAKRSAEEQRKKQEKEARIASRVDNITYCFLGVILTAGWIALGVAFEWEIISVFALSIVTLYWTHYVLRAAPQIACFLGVILAAVWIALGVTFKWDSIISMNAGLVVSLYWGSFIFLDW